MRIRTQLTLLLLLCPATLAYAQGQGSYGGIAGGFVSLVLITILVFVVLALLLVGRLAGPKVALSIFLLLATGIGYLAVSAQLDQRKRDRAVLEIRRAYAEGCARSSRHTEVAVAGNEPIFVMLDGAPIVPDHLKHLLLPRDQGTGPGVSVVKDLPKDADGAIAVSIRYDREMLPGSFRGYEWYRTSYEVRATKLPGGELIARTVDMEARNGFCLGDLEPFLRRALNRPSVLIDSPSTPSRGFALSQPDAYVRGEYAEPVERGIFDMRTVVPNARDEASAFLRDRGCLFSQSTISPTEVTCERAPFPPVRMMLGNLLAVHQLPASWLLVRRVDKGMDALTSLHIEQRGGDWALLRSWEANFVPPPDAWTPAAYLAGVDVSGEAMTLNVLSEEHWNFRAQPSQYWFTRRATLTIPLPGLVR